MRAALRRLKVWIEYSWVHNTVVAIVPLLAALPSFTGVVETNPAVLYSGLASEVGKPVVPGLPSLDPNVGFTSQALGHLAALDWLHGTIPWWNPYEGVGTPLAGEMQSAALFLPFVLLLYFPNGQTYFHVSLELIAGFATQSFLSKLGFTRLVSTIGAVLFELNGTFAWFAHAPFNPIAFMPLTLVGIEAALFGEKSSIGWVWISIGIAGSIYAGFPETAYIDGLFILGWTLVRMSRLRRTELVAAGARVAIGGAAGLLISAPSIVSLVVFLRHGYVGLHSGEFGAAHLPVTGLPMLLIPYLYGPPAAFSARDPSGVLQDLWGQVGGYATITLFYAAALGISRYAVREKCFLTGWVVFCIMKTFGVPLITDIWNCIPLIRNSAFFRYSDPSWEFSLITLASYGLSELRLRSRRAMAVVLVAEVACTAASFVPALSLMRELGSTEAFLKWLEMLAIPEAALFGVLSTVAASRRMSTRRAILPVVLMLESFSYYVIPILSNPTSGEIDTGGVRYLQANLGLQRFFTLGPVAPNYGAYYHIASINHNDLPVPSQWADYVQRKLDPNTDKILFTGMDEINPRGLTPVQALRSNLSNYEWLGVKYIVMSSGSGNPLTPFAQYGVPGLGNVPYVLGPNSQLEGMLQVTVSGVVVSFSVFVGNYSNTSTGDILIKLWVPGSGSVQGSANVSRSEDNNYFTIPLSSPLHVKAGQKIYFRLEHPSGRPVAVWLWPNTEGSLEAIKDRSVGDKAALIRLTYQGASPLQDKLVYRDSVMEIYELAHYANFYSAPENGVVIQHESFNSVDLRSKRNAILIRRELYFPGWKAYVNGRETVIHQYMGLFQAVYLPRGEDHVTFVYEPPGLDASLAALSLGIVMVFTPVILSVFRRKAYFN